MVKEIEPVKFEAVDAVTLENLYEESLLPLDVVPTMFPHWNTKCRDEGGGEGLAHGWHVTIGGKTGQGKSILALNMAVAAMKHGHKAGYLSLEMSFRQLLTRSLAIASRAPIRCLEQGKDFDKAVFQTASQHWEDTIRNLLYVNQQPIGTLEQIKRSLWYLNEYEGVRFFVIDYMQLAWVSEARRLQDQITEVSHTIRRLGHEHKLMTVGLSQFNRETSKDMEHPPESTGLMGGSPLENDSDQVPLLDHTSYKEHPPYSAVQKFIIGKNRHGPCGWIPIVWDKRNLTVSEITDREEVAQLEEEDDKLPF